MRLGGNKALKSHHEKLTNAAVCCRMLTRCARGGGCVKRVEATKSHQEKTCSILPPRSLRLEAIMAYCSLLRNTQLSLGGVPTF